MKPRNKREWPLKQVNRLIQTGPVVLVTTAHGGRANIMPMSWHTMLEFDPPLVGCVISREHFTHELLERSRECVLNLPTASLAREVVRCGNVSGRKTDKWAMCGWTPEPATVVSAPMIAVCYANLECRVRDDSWATKYDFIVLEVVRAWVEPGIELPKTLHHLHGPEFLVPGRRLKVSVR
jgi:flavin reductase (DIM6/NTAB) family NADH-FMN oxidoreductase RutF